MARQTVPPIFLADPNITLHSAVCRGCRDLDACAAGIVARLDPAMDGLYAEDCE